MSFCKPKLNIILSLLVSCLSIAQYQSQEISLSSDVQSCLTESNINDDIQDFDCSSIPQEFHKKFAIELTFCHLKSTGIKTEEICPKPEQYNECLKNLTKHSFAFLTYTNFLPHIQSVCYSMETQRWHRKTQNSIDHLDRQSNRIQMETKHLYEQQKNIQTSLDQTLQINQKSVDDALTIDRFLQVAQADVEDLRGHLYVKDKAQIQLIHQILDTLFNIQSSLFNDAFGLSSYIFYCLSLLSIHLFTMPERTNDAKFWLVILWTGLIALERYLLIFSAYSEILLYNTLWRLRQFCFLLCCLILSYYAVRYRNYSRENQKLIEEIDAKHKRLKNAARKCLHVIKKLELSEDSDNEAQLNESMTHNETLSSNFISSDDE